MTSAIYRTQARIIITGKNKKKNINHNYNINNTYLHSRPSQADVLNLHNDVIVSTWP